MAEVCCRRKRIDRRLLARPHVIEVELVYVLEVLGGGLVLAVHTAFLVMGTRTHGSVRTLDVNDVRVIARVEVKHDVEAACVMDHRDVLVLRSFVGVLLGLRRRGTEHFFHCS